MEGVDSMVLHRRVPAVPDQAQEWNSHAYRGSPEGVTAFQQARILDRDDGGGSADPEAAGQGEGLALPGHCDQMHVRVGAYRLEEGRRAVVGDPNEMARPQVEQGVQDRRRGEGTFHQIGIR